MQCSPAGTYRGALDVVAKIIKNEVWKFVLVPICLVTHVLTRVYSLYTREQALLPLDGLPLIPFSLVLCIITGYSFSDKE